MSRRVLVASFDDEHRLLAAVRRARAAGDAVLDVHGPYPVHGLDDAMGARPSRLPWVCFAGGLAGLGLALGFQAWTSATDWPLNVGGKPLLSWPAFVPVAFEVTVLFAGLGVVAAFLAAELRRRRSPPVRLAHRATDDLFQLSVVPAAGVDPEARAADLRSVGGAVDVDAYLEEDAS